jgi:fibro-slime domain-containing protein
MSFKARLSFLVWVVAIAGATSCGTGVDDTGTIDGNSGGSKNGGSGGQGNGNRPGGGNAGISVISASCGDGTWQQGEACDDGNKINADCCNEFCKVEADCDCPLPPMAGTCANLSACGNGKLTSNEFCDDGNNMDGDGCSADCKVVTPGYQCRVPGRKCVPLCGDGQMIGGENCDDGNSVSDDGCSATCLIEPGATCTGTPSVCTKAVCGNGMKEAGEGCDLGPLNGLFNGDATGCSKTCTQEPSCRDASGVTQACASVCGDGNVDTAAGEGCDDGNAVSGDGCSETCALEGGFTCTDMPSPDTQACSTGAGDCLVLPITYRDFDGQNQPMGHPDFFHLGGTTTCVPNASGRTVGTNGTCWDSDSTPLCKGIASDALVNGKPALGATTECACRFTDWDGTGLVPATNMCNDSNGGAHNRIETMVKVVQSAASFGEWYADSTKSQKLVSTIELAPVGVDYQFSSSGGRTVYNDLHDIFMGTAIPAVNGAAANSLSSGFFPLEMQTGLGATKLCNLWPYWRATAAACVAADGNPVTQQWDPLGSYTAMTAGTGGPVKPVTGNLRNFYFTSEVRYLFRYNGTGSLAFYGDDDVWVYINGHLVLDLGAPHERLQGTITMTGANAAWTILTTSIDGTPVAPATGGSGTVNAGLEAGKTYEIVVFHADRHPRESNYQLTLSSFPTSKSACQPRCGDGVATLTEECDDGPANMDGVYGGCSTDCHFGPFCGDGVVQMPEEQCDKGRENTGTYGTVGGCSPSCQLTPACGDGIIDSAFGETCDDGTMNGVSGSSCSTSCIKVVL